MSILVDKNTRVVTQGITGATGQIHTRACKEYGTQMVAGVVPGKGGTTFEGIPIFDTVEQARKATGCNASVSYVPPAFAALKFSVGVKVWPDCRVRIPFNCHPPRTALTAPPWFSRRLPLPTGSS